ncbi:uncharacterized protein mrvi1 isoform X2 [Takifugu flavidus]|uniref:uncharacterized protein mrvi1 isoform X2 n=1 Tax=Takifugu flavidus TaxID=433684 RepID=UPI002544CEEE|nr:uncharacterized protein mrvi1 isoform X2 [Takifugu flavidus]
MESCGASDEDDNDRSGFSEHELLEILYDACNSSSTGEVLASTIIHYLQSMTTQSHEHERLAALRHLLDPDCQDPHVSREAFHSVMREWITQCSQDSTDVEGIHAAWPSPSNMPVNGLDFSGGPSQDTPSESPQCSCDDKDLLGTVAELKRAHRKLNEQNSSLLRSVAQCEDINLQLTLEVTELRAKLASAQRSATRVRSLTEELEETRRAFKEAQERASRSQTSCTKLSNEIECHKLHIRRLEDKNEKLGVERAFSEDSTNKLRKVNAELRGELEETLVLLTLRDTEITKRDMLMDKMKSAHVENHNMIEGLQSELMRLQEHSHQILLRYDRHCISLQSLYAREAPNHRSLQSELQDVQQHHRPLELPPLRRHGDDIQSIIHRIKSADVFRHLHLRHSDRAQDSAAPETPERPLALRQQQQASIKQQLVNVLQELELHKCMWEEKGEKVEERRRSSEQNEQKQSQTGSQINVQDAKKVAVVNWWKACRSEGATGRKKRTVSETEEKLQQAEQTISDMQEQLRHLQTSLRSAQERESKQTDSTVVHTDKGTNTEEKDADRPTKKLLRDAAVATEDSGGAAETTQLQVTANGLLTTLRRMEALVSNAMEKAELVRESEQRVSQVTVRMESITQRVEEALERAADTDQQLSCLEARITQASAQSAGPEPSADFRTHATCPVESKGWTEPENEARAESPPPSPDVKEPPQLPLNGGTGPGSCSEFQEDRERSPQTSIQGSDLNPKKPPEAPSAAESPFVFPHTRSRPSLPPAMPTLPEEEEDSPEDLDSSSSSPSTSTPGESRAIIMTAPTIVYPQQATVVQQDGQPLEQNRPHSPRSRLSRSSSGGPITTVDSTGNVIDLVKDHLPELQLSEEDRQKNLELLEQAKKVSDRFLTRRGRRSTTSLSESPTGLSSAPSASSSTCAVAPQSGNEVFFSAAGHTETSHISSQTVSQGNRLLVDWKPNEKRKVSSGTLAPRYAVQKENFDPAVSRSPPAVSKGDDGGRNLNLAPATGVAKPVPRPPTQQAPCTAEIKTIGAFPPLMRAVSWDSVGSIASRSGAQGLPPTPEDTFSDRDNVFKASGYSDLSAQPGSLLKLSKFKEEHKLMRNQSIAGSALPDLSEAAEQEKGASPSTAGSEEAKEKADAMPNISDVMLRKLKLHRGLPGCAPPLTEKEVENAFVQLSLAFRNDKYTLEMRLKQAERERNLTEEDTEKELEEFKGALKVTSPQWQNLEQRESYQRLVETVSVLHRLARRLSSRAELVGAVRQEKRMSKATEVMMQYVENLKRTYEKDHAELTEFKKLANQNSNRSYGGSVETGDDGVPRPSRSMSLTLGKALPRRRVSVAVVPKFNLLNIPGQTPVTSPVSGSGTGPTPGAALPVVCENNDVKVSTPTEAPQPAAECGKSVTAPDSEPAKPPVNLEEIRAELKAKIEEEAYNKGYQEGLKHSKALQEKRREEEEEDIAERLLEMKNKDEESGKKINKSRGILSYLSVPSLSSQEDGGGPAPHWPRLSQDLPESTPPPDGADAVRGDVSDHQHFHLLRRILQQARGHVSRGGSLPGEGRRNSEVSVSP